MKFLGQGHITSRKNLFQSIFILYKQPLGRGLAVTLNQVSMFSMLNVKVITDPFEQNPF